MSPDPHSICCASLPRLALGGLADLRCHPDLRVIVVGEMAWLFWPPGRSEVLQRVLSVPGAEPYLERQGLWFRLHRYLPSNDLPNRSATQPLAHVLTPAPITPLVPATPTIAPLPLRLVASHTAAPTTGLLCNIGDLARWSDTMPSDRLATLQITRLDNRALVLGRRLPLLPASERFWGENVLVPLGLAVEPALPETELRDVLRLATDEIGLLWAAGFEAIPRHAFAPLTRARLRLACKEIVDHAC
jgi:hypothetical protein